VAAEMEFSGENNNDAEMGSNMGPIEVELAI
jgi:hypothetical protein